MSSWAHTANSKAFLTPSWRARPCNEYHESTPIGEDISLIELEGTIGCARALAGNKRESKRSLSGRH